MPARSEPGIVRSAAAATPLSEARTLSGADPLAAELRAQHRLAAPFERQLIRDLAPALAAQAEAGAEAAQAHPDDETHFRQAVFAAGMSVEAIAAHLERVALAFGDHALRSLGRKGIAPPWRKAETDDVAPGFLDLARRWAQGRAAELVVQIDETTRERIRAAVDEALRDGQGARPLARRIVEMVAGVGGLSAKARALTIARTETHQAAAFGADAAAEATGLTYDRIWCSARDSRTRADHAAANGQRRAPGENFSIGGFSMPRPGVGPASQTVSCRCVLRYVPQDFRRR